MIDQTIADQIYNNIYQQKQEYAIRILFYYGTPLKKF